MVFRLLAPAILPLHKKIEEIKKHTELKSDDYSDIPLNKIDSNIFRTTRLVQNNSVPINEPNLSPRQVKKKQGKPKYPTKLQRKPIHLKK